MKIKKKNIFQYCLPETYVEEVLNLPKTVRIEELTYEVGFSLKRIVTAVPLELAKLGVTYLREPATSVEANGILTGTRQSMEQDAKKTCALLKLDYRHMKVKRIVFEGDIIFTRMTKKMLTNDTGKTKAVKVLGFISSKSTESETNKIISKLNAKKIKCETSTEIIQTVICR